MCATALSPRAAVHVLSVEDRIDAIEVFFFLDFEVLIHLVYAS